MHEVRDPDQPLLCAFSFNYHDSSVAVARGNEVLLVVEAERALRRKKARATPQEMAGLIEAVLKEVAATPDDVAHWAATALNNPWIDGACLAEGADTAETVTRILGKQRACLVVGHHRCHAVTFYFSGLDRALIGICDGGGDGGQLSSWYSGNGLTLERIDTGADPVPVSGLLYRYVSDFLFGRIHCEGKLMALAAYGEVDRRLVMDLTELSCLLLPFDVEDGFQRLRRLLGDLDGRAVRDPLSVADIARSLQVTFEEARLRDVLQHVDGCSDRLVLAGGACLNIGANRQVYEGTGALPYIAPCCDDTGQALGALAELIVRVCGRRPEVPLPYTGQGASEYPKPETATVRACAEHLAGGGILLVHNGASEIGPRALGHRSFLARATSGGTKRLLSEHVKGREWYRPVAPVIRERDCTEFFRGPPRSDYMLFSYDVHPTRASEIPGCVHVDGTARVQTLAEGADPFLEALLECYGRWHGLPLLLNTSLNLKGEPLANDIRDSYQIVRRMPVPGMLVHDGHIVAA